MEDRTALIRACGVREIATGPGLDAGNPQRGDVGLALAGAAGMTVLGLVCARQLAGNRDERFGHPLPMRDYGDRSGLPRPPAAMRGVARDFEVPRDMRVPEPPRPDATA